MSEAVASSVILIAMLLLLVCASVFAWFIRHEQPNYAVRWRTFGLGASVPLIFMWAILVSVAIVGAFGAWRFLGRPDFTEGMKIALVILPFAPCVSGRLALYVKSSVGE